MNDRKIAAKSASSIFYEEYNDIDIYVEDKAPGYRKIFKEMFNKALGSSLSCIGKYGHEFEKCYIREL